MRSQTHFRATLKQDLLVLGVVPGDILFLHSSFKSLGNVEGGAAAVIGALEDVVGSEGLLLLPSFNLVAHELRAATWDVDSTPSNVGWLSEFFRCLPGTARSDHYSHSVAARGKGARAFVADHLCCEGLSSPWDRGRWGKTYGTSSPMYRAYRADGQLLMLGVDYETSTYIHLVEVLYWDRLRRVNCQARFPSLDRCALGAFWENAGMPPLGLVGEARSRLFRIASYVDSLLTEVTVNPTPYVLNGG